MDGVGARESWGSVAEPGKSGGGEEEREIGGTAADEGVRVEVGGTNCTLPRTHMQEL